ncbi:BadM/Rrf2 family transcriptional regulator [Halospina denitrificans]|uniref:BadM/Rrf2 family transcriptional regulator n=1 Tax=Halospina denitrificans TaxID=332522 RepID=A0A4R7K3Q2_9GAMM|nr:Rrf2 family transcriptional regulator [Halospina denitrificans]TDT44239.1 BadM/Rrf2 family transcriptional regulator [Halospina denitrificans]
MRLTLYTDYAVRMLMFVALRDGQRGTIREIAAAYGISRNHLMKVAHNLQREGYLTTTRGKGGGLQLALPSDEIHLGTLVRTMEPDLILAECFGPCNQCVITPSCQLKFILDDALKAFLAKLDEYTLDDVTSPRAQKLRQHLGLTLDGELE